MPVVNTNRTFTANEQVTATKLNDIMDQSVFVANAVVSGQGLEITGAGQIQIGDGQIASSKLSTGAPSWNTTSVSIPSATTITGNTSVTGNISATGTASFTGNTTIGGNATISGNAAISGTTTSTGALTVGSATMPVPNGSMPLYPARAWVNFDITVITFSGTVSRTSGSTTCTVTLSNHGFSVGNVVYSTTAGISGFYTITEIVSSSQFRFLTPGVTSALNNAAISFRKATINSSSNVNSIVSSGTGSNTYYFNFTSVMPSTSYCALFSLDDRDITSTETTKSTGNCLMDLYTFDGTGDPQSTSLSAGSHDAVFFA